MCIRDRRITVLLEDDGGEEDRLEAVRTAVPHDAAKASLRRPAVRFLIVRQAIEIPLHRPRCVEPRNQPLLARGELNRL